MKLNIETTKSLKESLVSKGFLFPCGGKGICGRCRIIAPLLPETPLDIRFLSEYERANGMRLACDKHVDVPMEIDCLLQKGNHIKVEEPSVTAVLNDENAIVLLSDGTSEAERLTLPLSLDASGREILAAVQKNSIELYEKHGVAKAVTLGIFGTANRMNALFPQRDNTVGESYDATELSLPSEEGYLAPTLQGASGQLLSAAVVSDSPVAAVFSNRAELLSPKTGFYAELTFPADFPREEKGIFLDAAMARLDKDNAWQIFGEFFPIRTEHAIGEDVATLCATVQSARKYRAKLNRLASSLTKLNLAEDEEFQAFLSVHL